MGSKYTPRQTAKRRSHVARGMIEAGTGKGGPMRDRRERRLQEQEDLRLLSLEDSQYDDEEPSSR